jgi:pyridoxamine 5'-phosphate oxidase|tara:strand:+ start:6912 stop:7508 length:597 start_codon:yes stop_codon:yes gene_type:complete
LIKFINILDDKPHLKFKGLYDLAILAKQYPIDAVAISSYSIEDKEVDSRFINLKYIIEDKWIFFSNYSSPKAIQFQSHDQISALIFWPTINAQIRIKAIISKTSKDLSDSHYRSRSIEKNALSHSSQQSLLIDSYESIKKNYNKALGSSNLKKCPDFWGGYSFTPYYFEFWEGHDSRLNKRDVYEMKNGNWQNYILQP